MISISTALAWIVPVVLAVTLHEAAHGWMAERYGDNTARSLGRVTFNPLKHIDPFGTILLPGLLFLMHAPFIFGYAKPVPVNFNRLRPPRLGMLMTAAAGPGTNILLALISGLLLRVAVAAHSPFLVKSLAISIMANCALAIFNMIPILPLDGGRVMASLLTGAPRRAFDRLERYGIVIVLLALMVPPMFGINLLQEVLAAPVFWLIDKILWITGNNTGIIG